MTIQPQLGHTDFPFWRETFATARGRTSVYVDVGYGSWRRYGHAPCEYTFMGASPKADVTAGALMLARAGARLKSLTFTTPAGATWPIIKGPPDYFMRGDFDPTYGARSSKTRQTIRRACRGVTIRPVMMIDIPAVWDIFNGWVAWAKTRHFMTFVGHYRRWLEQFIAWQAPPEAYLYILELDGEPVAIFGGEVDAKTREAQVHIAKHLPAISAKAMWVLGLGYLQERWGPTVISCGSTADKLKLDLGMEPRPTWALDIKRIKEEAR